MLLMEERGPLRAHRVDLLAGHLAPARIHLLALLGGLFVKERFIGGREIVGVGMSVRLSMASIALLVVFATVTIVRHVEVARVEREGGVARVVWEGRPQLATYL